MAEWNREDYLHALEKELKSIGEEECAEALEYYQEYFEEAGPEMEREVIKELGSPKSLAAQIKAQCAVREAKANPRDGKKGLRAVWMVLASIFAVPIGLPIAIALAVLVLALLIALLAVLISLFAAAAAIGIVGVAVLVMSLPIFVQNPIAAMTMLGMGMACAGLGGLLFIPTLALSRWCFRTLAITIQRIAAKKSPV